MNKIKKLIIFFLTMILLGCSNGNIKNVSALKMVQVRVNSESTFHRKDNLTIIFKLWGRDISVEGSKPTLLREYNYRLYGLPVTYSLEFLEDWIRNISPKNKGEYRYYITIDIPDQEYEVDYENTSKNYLKVVDDIRKLDLEIYLKR